MTMPAIPLRWRGCNCDGPFIRVPEYGIDEFEVWIGLWTAPGWLAGRNLGCEGWGIPFQISLSLSRRQNEPFVGVQPFRNDN